MSTTDAEKAARRKESNRIRQRRYYLHKTGDHSECRPNGPCSAEKPADRVRALGAGGRALWEDVTQLDKLTAIQRALLLQACRIKDRLDGIDRSLRQDGEFLRVVLSDDGDVATLVVNRALAEERAQAIALKSIVHELHASGLTGGLEAPVIPDKSTEPAEKPPAQAGGGGTVGDLTARIAERIAQAKG